MRPKKSDIANSRGVEHLHIRGEKPEIARQLKQHIGESGVFNPLIDPRHPAVPLVPADTIAAPGEAAGIARLKTQLKGYDRLSPYDESVADETRRTLRTRVRRATGRDEMSGR